MLYIERDERGAVIAAWTERQYPTQAALREDDPALFKYLNASPLSIKLAAIDLTLDDLVQIVTRVGVYVDRDASGLIVASYDRPLRNGHEMVPRELPELQRFLAKVAAPIAPEGYAFRFIEGAGKFRVLRLRDNFAVADGLESLAACAVAAAPFANARNNL